MRILIVGDYERAPYHSLLGVDTELKSILVDHEVTCTGDYEVLVFDTLQQYDLFICYMDAFKFTFSTDQTAGIMQYVATGGKTLFLHNGISVAQKVELGQMLGAKFITHPKRSDLVYSISKEHPVVKGISDFVLYEEPYQYDFIYGTECEYFLQYEYEGNNYPAGWSAKYGLGEIVYLQPGHDPSVFQNENVQSLILNAVAYLLI